MIVFSWNVRGFNEPQKVGEVKKFIVANEINIIILLETRIRPKNVKKNCE